MKINFLPSNPDNWMWKKKILVLNLQAVEEVKTFSSKGTDFGHSPQSSLVRGEEETRPKD